MPTDIQKKELTPRQLQVLRQIHIFQASQCYSATIAELAQQLGVSRTTAFEHVSVLRRKGLMLKSRGRVRSLRLTAQASRLLEKDASIHQRTSSDDGSIPLAGRVAAGIPIEAIENTEPVSLTSLFGGTGDTFALQVAGDSMIDEGINDGDYVVCKHASQARNGQLVVAIVDDENATLKRFYKEADVVRLEAANEAYEPIFTRNCRIEAIVLGLLRSF